MIGDKLHCACYQTAEWNIFTRWSIQQPLQVWVLKLSDFGIHSLLIGFSAVYLQMAYMLYGYMKAT
jgi:hypothetical protein